MNISHGAPEKQLLTFSTYTYCEALLELRMEAFARILNCGSIFAMYGNTIANCEEMAASVLLHAKKRKLPF
jgi:hypothetical protein